MRHVMVSLFLGVMACGSSSRPPSTTANAAQAGSFDQAALTAANAVTRYQQAASRATTPTECSAALRQYAAQLQPLLDQLRSLARPMDDYVTSAGNMMAGDMECGVQVMADELVHHQALACTSADMTANHAEAQRDVDAMMAITGHLEMRSVQVGGMMGEGGMMAGPGQTMDAGWMSGWTDGGWRMPDGGMVSYDQAMPGCTYTSSGVQAPDAGFWMDGGWTTGPGMMDGGYGPAMDGGTGSMMDAGTTGGGMMDGGPGGMMGGR